LSCNLSPPESHQKDAGIQVGDEKKYEIESNEMQSNNKNETQKTTNHNNKTRVECKDRDNIDHNSS
jgi:hypothetical protein